MAAACLPEAEGDLDVVPTNLERIDVEVVDGDSLRGADGTSYRLIGINAPDVPECLAEEAAERLLRLVADPVGLPPIEDTIEDQFGRELVSVFRIDGSPSWVNRALVREGLAIAVHTEPEMPDLFDAQDLARRHQVGVWDPEACGDGPLAAVEIIDAQANPPGRDEEALNEEWVVIANRGAEPVDLTGWSLRDESTQNRYSFPTGFVLDPGKDVTVTSGDGRFGFDLGSPVWNNGGDTALLVDDQGRFVSFLAVEG